MTKNAIITGASAGLGRALATTLAEAGWRLTLDGRRAGPLEDVRRRLAEQTQVQAVVGDVSDPVHRRLLLQTAASLGPVDLLVNNASELGGSPPPRLRDLTVDVLHRLVEVNVSAPQALVRAALPVLSEHAVVINVSSDAGVEHYEGWGGYGATKAALDHLTLTWAAEEPQHRWYAVDPGDLRTALHQAAYPGEDISDRPEPESVVPVLVALIAGSRPSGRYAVADLATELGAEPAEASSR